MEYLSGSGMNSQIGPIVKQVWNVLHIFGGSHKLNSLPIGPIRAFFSVSKRAQLEDPLMIGTRGKSAKSRNSFWAIFFDFSSKRTASNWA